MDRTIRYARTADGIQIAYWTLGEGEPLLYMAGGPWNHIEVWDLPQCRSWYERLAKDRMLVRYDVRGTGLSQRDVDEISLNGYVADLEAVAGELGAGRFSLFAAGDAGPAAISYAVANPRSRIAPHPLVRLGAWGRLRDLTSDPGVAGPHRRGLGPNGGHMRAPGVRLGSRRYRPSGGRSVQSQHHARDRADRARNDDRVRRHGPAAATERAGLVLHRDAISWLPVEIASGLASGIPGSQLAMLPGETTAPYLGDVGALVEIVDAFLRWGTIPAELATPPKKPDRAAPVASEVPWPANQRTAGVVEIIPVYLKDGRVHRYAPDGSDSWRVAFEPSMHPGEVAVTELNRLDCAPTVVHSTSWRLQEEELVLTYLAVLRVRSPPPTAFGRSLLSRGRWPWGRLPARRSVSIWNRLRRTPSTTSPGSSRRTARSERRSREAWRPALAPYGPEPFSAFDLSGSLSGDDGCLLCARYSRPLSEFVAGNS